ncbi:hypothetical protein GJU41_12585 [Bacillus idriensis]|uniref:Uncharacterized protein n=1 Tax=Metabacillus idriensis TaxID=324768 RepID=A0A6I2MEF5_9BACI|nr:hypothetical protein [Metabacillus idriensis]MRX54811.1 hypothetical protein [Metabacillus idriensis]
MSQICVLKSGSKLELVRRVIELEKRGYECVAPISSKKLVNKLWKRSYGRYQCYRRDFIRTEEHELFMVKMIREETG